MKVYDLELHIKGRRKVDEILYKDPSILEKALEEKSTISKDDLIEEYIPYSHMLIHDALDCKDIWLEEIYFEYIEGRAPIITTVLDYGLFQDLLSCFPAEMWQGFVDWMETFRFKYKGDIYKPLVLPSVVEWPYTSENVEVKTITVGRYSDNSIFLPHIEFSGEDEIVYDIEDYVWVPCDEDLFEDELELD